MTFANFYDEIYVACVGALSSREISEPPRSRFVVALIREMESESGIAGGVLINARKASGEKEGRYEEQDDVFHVSEFDSSSSLTSRSSVLFESGER
ncbi:MAG: hypothetical protein HOI66_16760 [Verrucomicrobia bacterium]|nr:hypothetical protein [Verrucomicrobiota bacterium]